MWECGLKQMAALSKAQVYKSLLMWECGLKHARTRITSFDIWSLLMWECGLKQKPGLLMYGVGGHSLCGSVD